jgi:hypothetical protein
MGHKGWAQSWAHHERSIGLKPNWQRNPAPVQQVTLPTRDPYVSSSNSHTIYPSIKSSAALPLTTLTLALPSARRRPRERRAGMSLQHGSHCPSICPGCGTPPCQHLGRARRPPARRPPQRAHRAWRWTYTPPPPAAAATLGCESTDGGGGEGGAQDALLAGGVLGGEKKRSDARSWDGVWRKRERERGTGRQTDRPAGGQT